MLRIDQITNDSSQKQTMVLPDGNQVEMRLYYSPQQLGWFIRSLKYEDFELQGIRVTVSPNILNQWRNILPFGLACYSDESREPTLQDDFVIGAARLYILTEAEVEEYATYLRNAKV